jgi:hypothetical protein
MPEQHGLKLKERMLRYWCLILLMLSLAVPDTIAQSRQSTSKSSVRKARKKPVHKPAITVDTAVAAQPEVAAVPVPPPDTTKKDTSDFARAADVVHDSVKAQLKAPIVQVPIRLKTLLIPGALFAYGVVTQNNGGLRVFNDQAKEFIWDGKIHTRPYIEDYLLLAPAAAVYGMNIFGVHGQNNLIDRSIIYGMSNAIANGFVFGLKYFGIEQRPDSTDNYSFASGHTAEAFVSAEFLHQEYKGRVHWTVTAAGYAVATTVAYLRMYHNKHWLSDVVAGAGIGMASTRFSYYLYPLMKHLIFGSKKIKEDRKAAMIYPMYNPGNGAAGLGLVYRF